MHLVLENGEVIVLALYYQLVLYNSLLFHQTAGCSIILIHCLESMISP